MQIGDIVQLCNGNSGMVISESKFGKLLIVEICDDELPPTHWHNEDGSFYTDYASDLDVV